MPVSRSALPPWGSISSALPNSGSAIAFTVKSRRARSSAREAGSTSGSAPGCAYVSRRAAAISTRMPLSRPTRYRSARAPSTRRRGAQRPLRRRRLDHDVEVGAGPAAEAGRGPPRRRARPRARQASRAARRRPRGRRAPARGSRDPWVSTRSAHLRPYYHLPPFRGLSAQDLELLEHPSPCRHGRRWPCSRSPAWRSPATSPSSSGPATSPTPTSDFEAKEVKIPKRSELKTVELAHLRPQPGAHALLAGQVPGSALRHVEMVAPDRAPDRARADHRRATTSTSSTSRGSSTRLTRRRGRSTGRRTSAS